MRGAREMLRKSIAHWHSFASKAPVDAASVPLEPGHPVVADFWESPAWVLLRFEGFEGGSALCSWSGERTRVNVCLNMRPTPAALHEELLDLADRGWGGYSYRSFEEMLVHHRIPDYSDDAGLWPELYKDLWDRRYAEFVAAVPSTDTL